MKEIIIIGAGHNGLIVACYLAKAGHKVTIFEQSPRIGGLCINEEFWPGYVSSTWANWFGMLRPDVITDLGLELEPLLDDPGEVALTYEGGCVTNDDILIDGLTEEDMEGVARFEEAFEVATTVLKKYFMADNPRRADFLKELEQEFASLDLPLTAEEFVTSSLLDVAAKFVQHPELQAVLGANSFVHPAHPGSAYGLMIMCLPETFGTGGDWGLIRGGMGTITKALAEKATNLGVTIHTEKPVTHILHDGQKISGLMVDNIVRLADYYLCGTDYATLQKLLGRPVESDLRNHGYGVTNIHIKLSRLPRFTLLEKHGLPDTATFSIIPPLESMRENHAAYVEGKPFAMPVLSLAFPTVLDQTRAPEGKHVMCLHPDHAPLRYSANGWTDHDKRVYVTGLLDYLTHYAPDIKDCVEDWVMLTPDDLQSKYGASGAHCFHGDLSWDYTMDARLPVYGAGPQTDISNLYICGAASHPGGTVSGAPGYRCAHRILKEID